MNNGLYESSKYRVEKEIEGDNFIIVKAYDNELKMFVAIKALGSNLLQIPEAEKQFVDECQLLAKIHSDQVLRVLHFYEKGSIGDRAYLVMEWMDQNLEELLNDKPVATTTALQLVKKLAYGLAAIHQQGILHHDIRPENVMLSADLIDVKIGDFGFATEELVEKTHLFSPKYTAPENYYPDQKVGKQSDIYSLGVIAYELFLGRDRFRTAFDEIYSEKNAQVRKTRWQHWHMNQGKKVPSLSEVDSTIQTEISDMVDRMLAKEPEQRYFEVSDLLSDLDVIEPTNRPYIQPISPSDFNIEDEEKTLMQRLVSPMGLALIFVLTVSLSAGGYFYVEHLNRQELNATLLSTLEKVKALRKEVIDLGANDTIEQFADGESDFDSAQSQYASGNIDSSLAHLIAAATNYRAVSELLMGKLPVVRQELDSNRTAIVDYVNYIKPDDQAKILAEIETRYQDWSDALTMSTIESTKTDEDAFIAALDRKLAMASRLVEAGSTPAEIDKALATCDSSSISCSRSWYDSEVMRDVQLTPFTLDASEVSRAEFADFVAATGYESSAEQQGFAHIFNGEESVEEPGLSWRVIVEGVSGEQDNLPALYISARDASNFCIWRDARLPTAEEWEYASRGPERHVYSWGNNWDEERAASVPQAVGSDPQESFFTGLTDMTGNVWEWVKTGDGFGLKGGSFLESTAANFRSAAAREEIIGVINIDDGFRCAQDVDVWPMHRKRQTLEALLLQ